MFRDGICNSLRKTIIIILISTYCAINIEWELTSRPVIFGNTTMLLCNISDPSNTCSGTLLQWLGGKKYGWLCSDTSCVRNMKYEVVKPTECLYTLLIHNFSESDVNIDYTCLYGIFNDRKALLLNQEDYLYIPSPDEIQISTYSHMNIICTILKIFPAPTCYMTITITDADVNHTERIDVNTTRSGMFYTTEILVNNSLPACSDLSIYCFIRKSYRINIYQQSTTCKENMPATLIWVITIAVFAITGIAIVLYMYFRCRSRETYHLTEAADTENGKTTDIELNQDVETDSRKELVQQDSTNYLF